MKNKMWSYLLLSCLLGVFCVFAFGCSQPENKEASSNEKSLVLARETWTEPYILSDLFKILIEEQTDISIRQVDLDSEALCWKAFETKDVDILTAYTASCYMTILGDTGLRDPDAVYKYVTEEFNNRFGAVFLKRLGFYSNYDLAVRPEIAKKYKLKTYSDLAKVAERLTIVADVNFIDRIDCYPLLQEKYGMNFKDIKSVGVSIKYPTIKSGEADVVSVYSTDAQIKALGLVLLKDDKYAFAPYDAAPLVRGEVLENYPELKEALNSLAGIITNEDMQTMNYRVEVEKEESADVARDFLQSKGLI